MKLAEETLQARFGKAIGHTLRKIVASVHVFNAEALCDVPLCLWLFFDTLPGLRLSGAADGWSIQADDVPPEPIDLEESGGNNPARCIAQICLSERPGESTTIGLVSARISYR